MLTTAALVPIIESGYMENNLSEVLEVAAQAGHIMLENGAEIARVEDTMERISTHYGATKRNFFVLSNGIFTTGSDSGSERYANVEYIPLRGAQMDKIVKINQLSRDIAKGGYSLEEARAKVEEIRKSPAKPAWEQLLGSALGSAGFCMLFGGGFLDSAAALVVGIFVWAAVLLLGRANASKIVVNILCAALATLLCMAFHGLGFGVSLGNMIIGSIIPLIPGVPFTNGIRDIANEDYIAGITRLLDALFVFFGIALGVCIVFILAGQVNGHFIELHGSTQSAFTANVLAQTVAALVGTMGFAVLFGVPRNQYLSTGIVGAVGWAMFFCISKFTDISVIENTFLTSVVVVILSRCMARIRKCPVTVFMICGLFPLIPGAGVFWTTYYVTSYQLRPALSAGLTALSVTLAIVLAVIVVSGFQKLGRPKP